MRTPLILALLTTLLAGCETIHSTHNAPGIIAVMTPPAAPSARAVERPADPGEHVLVWNAGALGGLGFASSSHDGDTGVRSVSVESSVHLGTSKYSHPIDGGLSALGDGPRWGLNVGWTSGNAARPAHEAVYGEIQYTNSFIYSFSAGWAVDVDRSRQGPQFTASFLPLYVRTTTMLGGGTSGEVGLVIKIPLVISTWSL